MSNITYDLTERLRLNLQLFADGDAGADGADTNDNGADGSGESVPKNFDEVLKDKRLQAEFDRRISKALSTAKESWQKDEAERIASARSEAEKLAKMTAEQKAEHEKQARIKELEKREAELMQRELRAEALDQLSQKGLPKELISGVNLANAESCKASIEGIESAFRQAVQAQVEARLKSGTQPRMGGALDSEQAHMNLLRQAAGLK